MSSESILEKIRRQSHERVIEIEKKAREEADARTGKLLDDAQNEAHALQEQAQKQCDDIRAQARLSASLEVRKNSLAARRRVLDSAYDAALEQMKNADLPRRLRFIYRHVMEVAAESGDVTLVVNAIDRTSVMNTLSLWEKEASLKFGHPCTLRLSDETGAFAGGVILQTPRYDVDATLETLLAQSRRDGEPLLAKILFDGKE